MVLGDAVDLETDEAAFVHIIGEVGGGDPVDPRSIAVSLDDDPVAVPVIVPEGILCLWLDFGEPHPTSSLIVEPSRRPNLFAGYFALRTVDDPGSPAVLWVGVVFLIDAATDLDTRIEAGIALDLEFEHEVREIPLAQERIGAALHGCADDEPIPHLVRGKPAVDFPSVERLAIKKRHPALVKAFEACFNQADGQRERALAS